MAHTPTALDSKAQGSRQRRVPWVSRDNPTRLPQRGCTKSDEPDPREPTSLSRRNLRAESNTLTINANPRTSDDQQRRLSSWGGVLDFGFFATCNELDSTEDDHREAIKLTFARLRSDLESYADKTSVDRGIDRSKFFSINFDEASISMLTPEKISWRQFLGTRYDFQRDGLLVHGIKSHLNSLFFYQDEELEENIAEPMDLDELSDDASDAGFAYAFSDPPYPLCSNPRTNSHRVSLKEKGELFNELLSKVLEVSEASTIYRWPTDWSNYFDAGNEWWGTFLWTIANQGVGRIVVIAASSTD